MKRLLVNNYILSLLIIIIVVVMVMLHKPNYVYKPIPKDFKVIKEWNYGNLNLVLSNYGPMFSYYIKF